MALALHLLPLRTGVESFGNLRRNRKTIRTSPRPACFVNGFLVRRNRIEISIPGSRCVPERVSRLGPARCLVGTDVVAMDAHSGPKLLVEGGLRCWLASNISRVTLSEFFDVLLRFMGNLQLLGILAALAFGMGLQPPTALASRAPYSTAGNLLSNSVENIPAKSNQSSDLKKIEEGEGRNGVEEDRGLSQQTVGKRSGDAVTAEDPVSDDEFKNLSSKPYEITVPLRIVGLRGSIPPAWIKDFLGSQGKRVKLSTEYQGSLRSIFSELSTALESKQLTARSAMAADLVTIGDSWLSKAVSGGLIKPIEYAEQFEWYQRLGPKWQTLLRRDENGHIDSRGKVWGVPYRWGSLVIAYNRKKLRQHSIPEIKDWADLWKPELAGKISMVASPREIVGAVLKVLGASYNVNDFETDVPGGRQAVKEKFLALQHQVRLFDDDQYLKTLGAGEVWVAVGWSEDIISFAKRTSNIGIIAPQSGTSLWADLWAIPATTTITSSKVGGRIRGPSPLVLQWFDFCLQPARGTSFEHNVLAGSSPLTLSDQQESSNINEVRSGIHQEFSKESYSDNRQVEANPDREIDLVEQLTPGLLAKCEFLEPLSKTALDDFKWLLSRKAPVQGSPVGLLENLKSRLSGFFRS